jgi:hypothetical protein
MPLPKRQKPSCGRWRNVDPGTVAMELGAKAKRGKLRGKRSEPAKVRIALEKLKALFLA